MRRRLLSSLGIAYTSLAVGVWGCVGDSTVIPSDGGVDASSDGDAASPTCFDAGPTVFAPPPPGSGAFCGKGNGVDGGKWCAFGADCCLTQGAANTCASTCPGTSGDVACLGMSECPQDAGAVACCADGTLDTTTCAYPSFKTFQRSRCAATCTSTQTTLCESNADCSGPLKCVGATGPFAAYGFAICQ